MNLELVRQFLGWCTALNFGFLIFSTVALFLFQDRAAQAHQEIFKVEREFLSKAYFTYLAAYKVLILVFFLVPYLALCFL